MRSLLTRVVLSFAFCSMVAASLALAQSASTGTANQSAEFNGSSGSQIQMVTKRGIDSFHGSGYEYYFGTDVGAANNWVANHTPSPDFAYTPIPKSHTNRFGTSFSGARETERLTLFSLVRCRLAINYLVVG